MKYICIPEYGRIPRTESLRQSLKRLQRFDEKLSQSENGTVFDWGHLQDVRAKNHVGVVQVPGLTVEILPKIDNAAPAKPFEVGDPFRQRARGNLLYMLSLTRDLPLQERDLADQHLRRLPLLEMLIQIFLKRLMTELRRGRDQAYVHREENLSVLKGKLLFTQHTKVNLARHDRFYVGYDEFVSDTLLNRIIKKACGRLLTISGHVLNQQLAREAILDLADVSDVEVRPDHFQRVQLTRSSERFRTILNFCRLVLTEQTPSPSSGGSSTFSLLFPMEQLFEQFIGAIIRRHAEQFGTHRHSVHLQTVSRHRCLLQTSQGKGRFRMHPDILIEHSVRQTRLILDTKWKRLSRDTEDPRNGVSQADMYQLFAYAHRYRSPDNVLLYPKLAGVTPKEYWLQDDQMRRVIRIEFIDLNRDLQKHLKEFISEICQILRLHQPPMAKTIADA